jgi:transcriptional regulator with XRE-family HTH domain
MSEQLRAVRRRVGANIERLRRSRRLSQEQLAELAGNTSKHVGQIERGEVNVGINYLTRIARALSVDVAALFTTIPHRRRNEPPVFVANDGDLKQIEEVVRRIRAARVRASGD